MARQAFAALEVKNAAIGSVLSTVSLFSLYFRQMFYRITLCVAGLFFLASCHNKEVVVQEPHEKVEAPQQFVPVTAFIRAELAEMDSLPITPLKITTVNGKTDTAWGKKKDLQEFAQQFLQPVIDTATLGKYFKETSFMDQSIPALTFSYDPKMPLPDTLSIRRWDVYLHPQSQAFQRAYIEKQLMENGHPQRVLMTWKAKSFCSVVQIDLKTEKVTREVKMAWNN
jgi:hypothetical protein